MVVGRSPTVTSAISAWPWSASTNLVSPSRIDCNACVIASLSSTSSTTCCGAVAGPARSTSRAIASSRTMKSAAVSPGTGLSLLSSTLT